MSNDKYQRLRDALAAGPTPGPWRSSGDVIKPGESLFVATMAYGGGARRIVARVENRESGRPPDSEDFANAALMAAADPNTIRSLLDERDWWGAMMHEWLDKTEWVQTNDIAPRYLGMHRADILRDQIERLTLERDALHDALVIARGYVSDEIAYLRNAYRGHEELGRVPEAESDLARIDAALENANAR